MRAQARARVVLAVAIACGTAGVVSCAAGQRSEQITMRMEPSSPLSMSACAAEIRHFQHHAMIALSICAAGRTRSWYHAVLTNNGPGAYPACQATAFDSRGATVFSGQLSLDFGGFRAGLSARGHRSVALYWYLPQRARVRDPVVRYVATCSVDSSPPI